MKEMHVPALIILSPRFLTVYCLFPALRDLISVAVGTIFFLAISYLLGKLSRNIGWRKQARLLVKWDGMPSTRFLRHRDTNIDVYTKRRYHKYLQNCVPDLVIPTPEEELVDPAKADLIYESAVKWLLKKARDSETYNLLFHENISYGFARNLWAMKWWGLFVNLLVLLGTVALINKRYHFDLYAIPPEVWLAVTVTVFVMIVLLFFTQSSVHNKAKAYARTLLEVCDEEYDEKLA
ncbi:hypothetical protein EIZ39_18205 [Ammoniphilus sp. CFH 90114]|nr:hypothetical protein EIZ39_18205 [Ammoniphilus sp. CFH 90114]